MKKYLPILLIIGLLLPGCGGGDASTENVTSDDSGSTGSDEVSTVEAVTETLPPPLYPEGALDPAVITAETPVNAAALYEAYFIWDGKQVTLEGYPYIPYRAESLIVEDEIELITEPGSTERLATLTFPDAAGTVVRADQPITAAGTVEYYWTGDIQIADCEMLEDMPAAEPGLVTSPYVYDGITPILVGEFYEMFNAWMGRELIVDGYYHSTTTSTTSYGVTVRVDLSDPDDTYTKYVACEMVDEIPESVDSIMVENREGTRIRGTVAGESFSMVGLENCVLVNR
jgi:hypothetical protein